VVAVDAEGVGRERQQRPVVRSDGAVANEGERLGGDGGRVVDDAALEAPRAQRPVRLVAPVGECLGGDRQPRRPADLESVGAGVRDEDEVAREAADRPGDRLGRRSVAGGPVVERAVRLDVPYLRAGGGRTPPRRRP
jgi:hypothetical protein